MIRGPVSSVVEGCVMSLMPTRSWSGLSFTLSLILYIPRRTLPPLLSLLLFLLLKTVIFSLVIYPKQSRIEFSNAYCYACYCKYGVSATARQRAV